MVRVWCLPDHIRRACVIGEGAGGVGDQWPRRGSRYLCVAGLVCAMHRQLVR
jgi:hypothetical protein